MRSIARRASGRRRLRRLPGGPGGAGAGRRFAEVVTEAYARSTGIQPDVYTVQASEGRGDCPEEQKMFLIFTSSKAVATTLRERTHRSGADRADEALGAGDLPDAAVRTL